MNDFFNADNFTVVCCYIILLAFVAAWIYVGTTKKEQFKQRKQSIDQLPSLISTLGVLGTFMGITRGLVSFDTTDLDTSIPKLLDGLKTAFYTSLLGMIGSLILSRVVSHKFDKEESESEIHYAAKLIESKITSFEKNLPSILEKCNNSLVTQLMKDEDMSSLRVDIEQIKDDIEEIRGHLEELKEQQILNSIRSSVENSAEELPRLRGVAVTATSSISAMDNNLEALNDRISTIEKSILEIKENTEAL